MAAEEGVVFIEGFAEGYEVGDFLFNSDLGKKGEGNFLVQRKR